MKLAVTTLAVLLSACSPSQQAAVSADEAKVQQATDLLCGVATPLVTAASATDSAYVTFACSAAEAGEEAGILVTQLFVKVAAAKAAAFAAKHAPAVDGGAG